MIKIVIDENRYVWATASEILLEDDCGILNPSEPDEAGNIYSGERVLYLNNTMDIIEVENIPENWIAGAFKYINSSFVLDEESLYWKNHLEHKAQLKKESVPKSVTMRQARLALLQVGKLTDVAPAIEALPSPQKEAALIEWEFSSSVERNRPLVQSLGPLLNLSEEDLDNLFIEASKL